MGKLKMKKTVRVRLKINKSTDGIIESAAGTAKWNVKWTSGPNAGKTTMQSSTSLGFWSALDDAAGESSSSSEEGSGGEESDDGAEVYAAKKARFEKHRLTLVGKTVDVSPAL